MALTPRQRAQHNIDGLRQSISQMFRDLSNPTLQLTPEDQIAIIGGIRSLQDHLTQELARFERSHYEI
jgi:hypothetical protein